MLLIINAVLACNERTELVSGLLAPPNPRECEDHSWIKVQAVPVFRFDSCKMSARTPQVEDQY
jgi:hypothetical protein